MPRPALNFLLAEPQSLLRSTVAAVSRELDLARVDEASSLDAARQRLERTRYDGLLLAMDECDAALELLARLRAGAFASPADLPVVVMAADCSVELALQVKRHDVRRLVLKPFKVRTLLETIAALASEAELRETA